MKKKLFSLIHFVAINTILYAILIFIGFFDIKEIKLYIITFTLGSIAFILSLFFSKRK